MYGKYKLRIHSVKNSQNLYKEDFDKRQKKLCEYL